MSKIVRIIALVILAGFAYYIFKVQMTIKEKDALNATLVAEKDQLHQDRTEIQAKIVELNTSLHEKETRLRELSDVQYIKDALTNAQTRIQDMNKQLEQVTREKMALQDTSFNATNKLQNITQEYLRTTAELKVIKGDYDKSQLPSLKAKLEEISKSAQAKDEQIALMKKELTELQATRQQILDTSKNLEKKLKELESGRAFVQERLSDRPVDSASSDSKVEKELQRKIISLNDSLFEKDTRIKDLEASMAKMGTGKSGSSRQVAQLQDQIAKLEDQLAAAEEASRRLRVREKPGVQGSGATIESTQVKDQLRQISEILVRKEVELDKAKKDSMDAMDKVINLQVRIADLEKKQSIDRVSLEKSKDLERQALSLQSRLSESQHTLDKKTELIDSLQRNVEYLNQQLGKKDEEKRLIERKITETEAAKLRAEQELNKQQSHTDEVDLLYNSLRTQVAQLTDLLKEKENELAGKRNEITLLKAEITDLKARSEKLSYELTSANDRQKKTLEDLSAAIRLNSVLQEKMSGEKKPFDYSSSDSQDKANAEELRRKIEVILEPKK